MGVRRIHSHIIFLSARGLSLLPLSLARTPQMTSAEDRLKDEALFALAAAPPGSAVIIAKLATPPAEGRGVRPARAAAVAARAKTATALTDHAGGGSSDGLGTTSDGDDDADSDASLGTEDLVSEGEGSSGEVVSSEEEESPGARRRAPAKKNKGAAAAAAKPQTAATAALHAVANPAKVKADSGSLGGAAPALKKAKPSAAPLPPRAPLHPRPHSPPPQQPATARLPPAPPSSPAIGPLLPTHATATVVDFVSAARAALGGVAKAMKGSDGGRGGGEDAGGPPAAPAHSVSALLVAGAGPKFRVPGLRKDGGRGGGGKALQPNLKRV